MPVLASSTIASADYDASRKELIVTFRTGGRYKYQGVDQLTYDNLLAASSPGSYFARQIKGIYPSQRIG